MDNIDVPEIRMIAVENSLETKHYPLAEKLCVEALKKEPLLEELSKAYMPHLFALLLAQEGEVQRLLDVTTKHKSYVTDHGKQLAESFPEEIYKIYDEYILEEAKEAMDRGKYRSVCKIIKNFYEAGANSEAIKMIDRLSGIYQHRPAMIEELAALKRKLGK